MGTRFLRIRFRNDRGGMVPGKMDTFTYIVTVPKESYATLYLPVFDPNAETVTVDGKVYAADSFPREGDCLVLHLPCGKHQIEALR